VLKQGRKTRNQPTDTRLQSFLPCLRGWGHLTGKAGYIGNTAERLPSNCKYSSHTHGCQVDLARPSLPRASF